MLTARQPLKGERGTGDLPVPKAFAGQRVAGLELSDAQPGLIWPVNTGVNL